QLLEDTNNGGGMGANHNFVDITLFGHDASNVGAMIVDPTNPNVVYVGGSRRWPQPGDPPNHAFIRVDTGNMRDTSYVDGGSIPNDGEDISKRAKADSQAGFYDPNNPAGPQDPYSSEGVYWYDL